MEMTEIQSKMQQLMSEISSLENRLFDFHKTEIQPVETRLSALNQDEEELFEEFNRKVQVIREQKMNARTDLMSLADEQKALQLQLNALKADSAILSAEYAAQERLDNIKTRILDMIGDAPWKDVIFDYQMEDLLFMVDAWEQGLSGVMNANDMGLGKTFESAAFIRLHTQLFYNKYGRLPRVLWLTKKSLMHTTHREILKWESERKAMFVQGQAKQRQMAVELGVMANAIIIANYDALNTTPALVDTKWDIIFADEVHRLKGGANPAGPTLLWQMTKKIVDECEFFVPLTGSPIQNHPRDMWAYLHLFDPQRFPTVKRFESEYCYGYGDGIKVDFEALIKVMKKQVIRRRKDEVARQLPPKTRTFRYVEMAPKQQEVYTQMKYKFFVWLDGQQEKSLTATAIIAQLTRLRQIAAFPGTLTATFKDEDGNEQVTTIDCQESAKIDEAMDLIEEIVGGGEQVVVFSSQFNGPLYEVQRRVNALGYTCEIVEGKTSGKIDEIQQRFQQAKTQVLCVNAKTGGEGLNLQRSNDYPGGASNAIFLDLWWNPMFNTQAEDRVHRTGQINPVTIHIIQAEDSVDQYIQSILDEKQDMIDGIMEDKSLRPQDWKAKLEGLI